MAMLGLPWRIWVAPLLLTSAVLAAGCGGKSHRGRAGGAGAASVSDAGAANDGLPSDTPKVSFCEATLEKTPDEHVELFCDRGIYAIGGGFYRLDLSSASGDSVAITFASLEAGFFAVNGCVSASVTLNGATTYLADPKLRTDTVAVLRLERNGDELSGSLQGIFSRYADDVNGFVLITPTVRFSRLAISRTELACDCGRTFVSGDICQVPTCGDGSCYFVTCDPVALICTAP